LEAGIGGAEIATVIDDAGIDGGQQTAEVGLLDEFSFEPQDQPP